MWSYFDPQPWERRGQLYTWLGVHRVRGLAVGGLLWQRQLPRLTARLNGQRWIRTTVERYVYR